MFSFVSTLKIFFVNKNEKRIYGKEMLLLEHMTLHRSERQRSVSKYSLRRCQTWKKIKAKSLKKKKSWSKNSHQKK
jgi:hypothetical protein